MSALCGIGRLSSGLAKRLGRGGGGGGGGGGGIYLESLLFGIFGLKHEAIPNVVGRGRYISFRQGDHSFAVPCTVKAVINKLITFTNL